LRKDIAVSPEVNRSLKPKATGAFSATQPRKRLYALIDQVGQSHEPVLHGACSRRINIQHRLVYQVLEGEQIVKVLRFWSHYEY
jgi:mRNA-degrading endonuclease RelE of RelBE toxin-antitoxin system